MVPQFGSVRPKASVEPCKMGSSVIVFDFLPESFTAYCVVLMFICGTVEPGHLSQEEDTNRTQLFESLATTSSNLVLLQYEQRYRGLSPNLQRPVVAMVTQQETRLLTQRFQDKLFRERDNAYFLHSMINRDHKAENLTGEIVKILESYLIYIPTVVIFLENSNLTSALLQAVCNSRQLKWTDVIHNSEWILTIRSLDLMKDISNMIINSCMDFFTLISWSKNGTVVSRKSRQCYSSHTNFKFSFTPWTILNFTKAFEEFTKPRRISLEGFTLPVGVVENVRKNTDVIRVGNETRLEGYVMSLLDLVATALKFKFKLVPPVDDWNVGSVLDNGSATGLTGMLDRKEIAFSCVGMSKTENRLQAIDYVDTPIYDSPIFATYRLPQVGKQLDMTLIDVVHVHFVLACLGPAVGIGILGAVVHVFTHACTSAHPVKPSKADVGRLTSFPDHVCFCTPTAHANQTGRVLRGSWATFCFILAAAYSAYLITSFTVKPRELKLDSLRKLVENEQYRFGALKLNPALVTALEFTNDTTIQKAWQQFASFRKSDPSVFESGKKEQVLRILDGNYALLDHFNVQDTELYVDTDVSEIRSYRIHAFDNLAGAYWALPKNAFFKDQLNMAIVMFEESGVLRFLREKYSVFRPASKEDSGAVDRNQPVTMSRILIFVYICGCGTGVSIISLISELVISWSITKFKKSRRATITRTQ